MKTRVTQHDIPEIEGVEEDKKEEDKEVPDQHQEIQDSPLVQRSKQDSKPMERLSPWMEGKYHMA